MMRRQNGTSFLARRGFRRATVLFFLDRMGISPADYLQDCTIHVTFAIHSKLDNVRVTAVDTQPNLLHTVGITNRVLSRGGFEFGVFSRSTRRCGAGHVGMASRSAPASRAPVRRRSARILFPPSECPSPSEVVSPTLAEAFPHPSFCMPLKRSWRALLSLEGASRELHDLRTVTYNKIPQAFHLNNSCGGETSWKPFARHTPAHEQPLYF